VRGAGQGLQMATTLDEAGLIDTPEHNERIMRHLLEVGRTVTPEHRLDIRSEIDGPNGRVKILSTWAILPDGRVYLSTIKLIPRSS